MDRKFRFYRGWLMLAAAIFTLQGIVWVLLGSFDPLGLWDQLMFDSLFAGKQDAEVVRFRRFILGPFGATLAGYFVMVFCLAKYAFPQRQPWAYYTVVSAVLTWFLVDCCASFYHGAYFNILLVNLPCITILGIPLWGLRRYFGRAASIV